MTPSLKANQTGEENSERIKLVITVLYKKEKGIQLVLNAFFAFIPPYSGLTPHVQGFSFLGWGKNTV